MKIQLINGRLFKSISLSALATACIASTYAATIETAAGIRPLQTNSSPPTFSAIYRYSHHPSKTMLDSARVIVSDAGLRIDQMAEDSGNALIANFETDQLWFLDSRRELVHEVPVVAIITESEAGTDQMGGLFPGFIQFAPCRGMHAKFGENLTLHGHSLTRWQCHPDLNGIASNEATVEQLFSVQMGVVVWSQDDDGFLSELVDVRLRESNAGIFKPPSHYRDIDLEELIHGSSSIGPYQGPVENLNW